MEKQYMTYYSHILNKDMEMNIYGHGGRPVLYIPCQDGRFYDFENFKMADVCSEWLDGGKIIVRNKRIPKVNYSGASTGIGLQYIRNQYRDIAGAEIEVEETPDSFTVTVPILKNFE